MADTCASLAAEIAALRAEIAQIPKVDENRIVATTKAALQPDITTAVAAGGVVVVNQLKPQIEAGLEKAREALTKAFQVETTANNAQTEAIKASAANLKTQRDAAEATRIANQAKSTASQADIEAHNASEHAGTSVRTSNHAFDEARQASNKAFSAEKIANNSLDASRQSALESKLASGVANQADFKAGNALNRATTIENELIGVKGRVGDAVNKSSEAISKSVNTANEVSGLKGVVEGVKGRLGQFGAAISKLESAVGEAIVKAAEAIGISRQALSATAKLAGRILEIFNIIGTIFTLIEQLATLNVLGGRIDAVEAGLLRLGNDVSSVLGKVFQLSSRLTGDESAISSVREIANSASSLASSANLRVDGAYAAAGQAQQTAIVADGKARQSQTTADGAVRNAGQANENAKTAYQKAAEAALQANNASTKADTSYQKAIEAITTANAATTKANQATNKAGEAFGKALEALGTALTVLALYQGLKSLRGLQGIPGRQGLPGIRGLTGMQGVPGRDGAPGITRMIQTPSTPGRNGRDGLSGLPGRPGLNGLPGRPGLNGLPGRPGLNGLPGRPGLNGLSGRNGVDAVPYNDAGLKAFIAQQHTTTRTSILSALGANLAAILAAISAFSNAAILAILRLMQPILGPQLIDALGNPIGLTTFVSNFSATAGRFFNWAVLDRVLNLLTLAATIHNAAMLSNDIGQTLIGIIQNLLSAIGIKDSEGSPFNFSDIIGKSVEALVKGAIGEDNYKEISEAWAKANRIYQATTNAINNFTNIGHTIINGIEMIGGMNGKIGNALRIWGVVGEKAYQWFNPQPNYHSKVLNFFQNAQATASTIQMVTQVPIDVASAVTAFNDSTTELVKTIKEEDPEKKGVELPEAEQTKAIQQESKKVSEPLLVTLADIFDGED